MDVTTERPAGTQDLRSIAVLVALVAGALRLGLELWGLTTIPDGTAVWPSVIVLAGAVVPLVGSGRWLLTDGPWRLRLWLLATVALSVAAALAWTSRDRARWRLTAARRDLPYSLAAAAVVLGTLFPPTAPAVRPVAGDRWWEPLLLRGQPDLATIATFVLVPLLVGGALWAGARLPRALAAGLVGAVAAIGLASVLGNLLAAATDADTWVTPVGWLDLVGHLTLLVLAVRWWTAADDGWETPADDGPATR